MANNRMLLRCKACKEVYMIGKYYPVSWAWNLDADDYAAWLDKHDAENEKTYQGDLGATAEFYDLVYENSCDDFKWRRKKETREQIWSYYEPIQYGQLRKDKDAGH